MSIFLLFALFSAVTASRLVIVSSPPTVHFPDSDVYLAASKLSTVNAYILGLSSDTVKGFNITTNLLKRPRALTTITVISNDNDLFGQGHELVMDKYSDLGLDEKLVKSFGSDREYVDIDGNLATGSKLAEQVRKQPIKTEIPEELRSIYQLADLLKTTTRAQNNTADVFRIHTECHNATQVESAVNYLNNALDVTYGGQSVVELIVISKAAMNEDQSLDKAVAEISVYKLIQMRKALQVYKHTSTDYPAIFVIFLSVLFGLVFALVQSVVVMFSINPSKNNVLYRLSTPRLKKE